MPLIKNYRNALPVGYQLHYYRIQDILGKSRFGITYLALDTQLNSIVAIKEFFPNQLVVRQEQQHVVPKSEKEKEIFFFGRQRFIKENHLLAQLIHPHIVPILHAFQSHNTAYRVMAYKPGQSLAKVLQNGTAITPSKMLPIFLPLLSALEAIHQAGFIHLNIKPSNIYICDNDNSPILLDFGAARYALGCRNNNLSMMVTPGYAPFEQYQSNHTQSTSTDIYALAAVLYHAISGTVPIEAPKRVRAVKLQKQTDPLPLATQIGQHRYSKQLLEAIDWALEVSETDRPQTVQQWVHFMLTKSPERETPASIIKKRDSFQKPQKNPFHKPKPFHQPKKAFSQRVKRTTIAVLIVPIIAAILGFGYISYNHTRLTWLEQQQREHLENEKRLTREHLLALLQQPPPQAPAPAVAPLPSQEIRSLQGHQGGICVDGCITFSPDGRWLASASWDNTIKLWEVSRGEIWQTWQGHQDLVLSIAVSPNGLLLASGSADHQIKLWEVSTGKVLLTLKEEESWIGTLAFSPNGQILATEAANNTIKLWQLSSSQTLATLTGHESAVSSIAFSPNGQLIASASFDKTIKLWEVKTGQLVQTLTGHQKDVLSVAFSPNGQFLASGDAASTIKLWEVSTGQLKKTLKGHENWILSVTFSPNGRTLASASHDHTIKLWDVPSGKLMQTLEGHDSDVNSIAFSPDGSLLATGSRDKTIKLWQ